MRTLLILSLICLASCTARPQRPVPSAVKLPPEEHSLTDIGVFIAAIPSSAEVVVYEGLPHQMWDHDLYVIELRRPDIVWFEGYPFYEKPLAVPADERAELAAIIRRKEAHVPFAGYKLCGGYHPDYAVVWKKDGKISGGSLICFGCHEWKNFTAQGRLHEDLEPGAYAELQEILGKYTVQRPHKKSD